MYNKLLMEAATDFAEQNEKIFVFVYHNVSVKESFTKVRESFFENLVMLLVL